MESPCLLLVDDEPALADLLKKYLERLGYEVEACLTPADALQCFEADPSRYALVLTDLTLPGMSGDDMITRMRAIAPPDTGFKALELTLVSWLDLGLGTARASNA